MNWGRLIWFIIIVVAIVLIFRRISTDPDKITVKVVCDGCEASYTKEGEKSVTNYNVKGDWKREIWCERGSIVTVAARNKRSSGKIAVYVYLNDDLIDSDNSSGEDVLVLASGHVPKR